MYSSYLGRGMDPDGGVEQNVVTQLLEQQDAILQVAKVSGKGQHNVQDGPRHMDLGGLQRGEGGDDMSVRSQRRREQKGVNEVQHEKGRERTHAEKAEEELSSA